jgi:hypothetical protein
MSDKIVILIRQRSDDIQAFVKDKKGIWGKGRTPAEAVGDLVQSNAELFKIAVEVETAETKETA